MNLKRKKYKVQGTRVQEKFCKNNSCWLKVIEIEKQDLIQEFIALER